MNSNFFKLPESSTGASAWRCLVQSGAMIGVVIIFSCATLTACVGSASKLLATEPATPTWVTSPPQDTPVAYFGLGEGYDLADAKRAALKDIASKLRVVVSGTVRSQTTVVNGKVDRSAVNSVSDEVQKTEFKNYVLEKSAKGPNGFFALVRVDRLEFVRETKDKIAALVTQIRAVTAGLDERPVLEQFLQLRRIRTNMLVTQGYLQLLSAGEMGLAEKEDAALCQQWLNRSDSISSALTFQVQAKASDADLTNVVTNFLAGNDIRTSLTSNGTSATLEIAAIQKDDEIQRNKLTRLNIALIVRDQQGRKVSGRDYVVSGASLTDYNNSRLQAVSKFQAALAEAGLLEGLGFKFK